MARPTLFTSERASKICELLSTGVTKSAAALASGISESTFYAWQAENSEFAEAVEEAEGRAEVNFTSTLAKAACGKILRWERETIARDGTKTVEREYIPQDWKAGLEWLKRRRRVAWADSDVDPRKLSDAQLLAAIIGQQAKGESPNEE